MTVEIHALRNMGLVHVCPCAEMRDRLAYLLKMVRGCHHVDLMGAAPELAITCEECQDLSYTLTPAGLALSLAFAAHQEAARASMAAGHVAET